MIERFDNPYRTAPGAQPPALVGRDGELSAAHHASGLTRTGGAAQPIVFTGLRGMGKTALLRRCVEDARELGGVVLYAEASARTHLAATLRRSLEEAKHRYAPLSRRIGAAIDAALRVLPKASYELPGDVGAIALAARPEAQEHAPLVEALETLNAAVRKHDGFLVLAIDEIQESDVRDLLTLVRFVHLTAGTRLPVLFLGAGLPNAATHLHEVRTYTERRRYLRIGLLDRDETMAAIAEPAAALGVAVDDDALDLLARESAGYPFFVQDYASAAWIAHEGDRITRADVEASAPGVRRLLESGFYDERFRRLTPRELRYALALADLGPGAHASGDVAARLGTTSPASSSARGQLVRKDVVFAPYPGTLEFRMPLTDRYVATHRAELERRAAMR